MSPTAGLDGESEATGPLSPARGDADPDTIATADSGRFDSTRLPITTAQIRPATVTSASAGANACHARVSPLLPSTAGCDLCSSSGSSDSAGPSGPAGSTGRHSAIRSIYVLHGGTTGGDRAGGGTAGGFRVAQLPGAHRAVGRSR